MQSKLFMLRSSARRFAFKWRYGNKASESDRRFGDAFTIVTVGGFASWCIKYTNTADRSKLWTQHSWCWIIVIAWRYLNSLLYMLYFCFFYLSSDSEFVCFAFFNRYIASADDNKNKAQSIENIYSNTWLMNICILFFCCCCWCIVYRSSAHRCSFKWRHGNQTRHRWNDTRRGARKLLLVFFLLFQKFLNKYAYIYYCYGCLFYYLFIWFSFGQTCRVLFLISINFSFIRFALYALPNE